MMKYVIKTLRDPSTYAGLGTLAVTAGVTLPGWVGPTVALTGGFIGGLLAIFIPQAGDNA